jgi:hypothetical protein
MILQPSACVQSFVKPMPIVTAPQQMTREGSHTAGPSFLMMMLALKIVYEVSVCLKCSL